MDTFAKHPPFGEYQFFSELVGAATGILGGGKGGGAKAGDTTTNRDVGLTGVQFVKVSKNAFASVNKSAALAVRASQQALKYNSEQSLFIPLAVLGLVGLYIWKKGKA